MGDQLPRYTAAAVQASPVFLDREATVEKACGLIAEAGRRGARLIVFPEAYIPTFPYWPRALPHPERGLSIQAYIELYKNAVEIPSPATDRLCEAARRANAVVVMGLNEREPGLGATMFNTLLYINRDGTILGRHRKLMPTFEEKCVWGMGDGSDLIVCPTDVGRIGGLICGNNKNALWQYALLAQGEDVHASVWPNLDRLRPYYDGLCRGYALMGNVYVVVSCGIIREDQVPDAFPLKKRTEWKAVGGSGIVSPNGEWIAGPLFGEEGIVYGEIDFEQIIAARAMGDTVGHYARWDVARLELNKAPNRPVVVRPAAGPAPQAAEAPAPIREAVLDLARRNGELSEAELRRAIAALGQTCC